MEYWSGWIVDKSVYRKARRERTKKRREFMERPPNVEIEYMSS